MSKKCRSLRVQDFFLAGPTDDTYMLQAAHNAVLTGSKKHLKFEDGRTYQISAPITLSAYVITGLSFAGKSRISSVIQQNTDNVPIYSITGQYMHSNRWDHLQFTYKNMQISRTSASVFQINGESGSSFYNNVINDCWSQNHYMFMSSPVVNWWGNTYRDCLFGDFAGGINSVTAVGGEPNCRFERLYINCPSATQPLFNHNAVTAQFDNIEVNNAAAGATMLYDGGGGNYTIAHWALEVGTYNSNAILFNVPNGTLQAKHIYTNTLTIGAGATLTGVVCAGAESFFDVRLWQIAEFAANDGTFILSGAAGPRTSHFGKLSISWSANCVPWEVSGAVSADYIVVDDWNDQSRMQVNGDASVTITNDSAFHQVFSDLTAARVATLPDHRSLPTNLLFSGWRRRFVKTDTSPYPFTLNNSLGVDIATVPASNRGYIDIAWHREAPGGGWNYVLLGTGTY